MKGWLQRGIQISSLIWLWALDPNSQSQPPKWKYHSPEPSFDHHVLSNTNFLYLQDLLKAGQATSTSFSSVCVVLLGTWLNKNNLGFAWGSQFFSIKLKDDIRNIISSSDSDRRLSMLKRLSKVYKTSFLQSLIAERSQDLNKLQAANNGQVKAFNHILDIAYGRKGKLRWEIMKVRKALPICNRLT